MTGDALHVVFGAGGGAGGAVVRALAAQRRRARAVTRGERPSSLPPGVEHVRADAMDGDAVRRACDGATVVYHCVNTPYGTWATTLPPILEHLIAGAAQADATLVYCDNLYMYGVPDGPLTESSAHRPAGAKGRIRARLAERLLDAHARGTVRSTTARASDFFGPGADNTVAGQLVFPAALAGKRAWWLGSLHVPHSLHYIEDVGRQIVALGSTPRQAGEVWHLPAAPAVTGREFIERVFGAAHTLPKMSPLPRRLIEVAGVFSRRMKEVAEIVYQFEQPFVIDGSKFLEAFPDCGPTSLRDAIDATVATLRSP